MLISGAGNLPAELVSAFFIFYLLWFFINKHLDLDNKHSSEVAWTTQELFAVNLYDNHNFYCISAHLFLQVFNSPNDDESLNV